MTLKEKNKSASFRVSQKKKKKKKKSHKIAGILTDKVRAK